LSQANSRARLQVISIVIGIFVSLVVFVGFPTIEIETQDREGLRPREGISITHSEHIHLDTISFYVVTTRELHFIDVWYFPGFIQDNTKPGIVAVVFPYEGTLSPDTPEWESANFNTTSAFVKKYSCSVSNPCFSGNDPERLTFVLDSKIDAKDQYRHGIKVKFDSTISEPAFSFFYNSTFKDDRLHSSYDNSTTRQATIILDETADYIHPIPIPEPDVFHNSAVDYSNTQLDWHLTKQSYSFFVNYEIPAERIQYETTQFQITIASITIGMISIGVAFYFGKLSGR